MPFRPIKTPVPANAHGATATNVPSPRPRVRPVVPAPTSEPEYKTGYKHPPKDSQFKPGQSGNPKGRPRGAKGLKTIVKDVMTSKVAVKSAEGVQRRSRIEVVVMKQAEAAMTGKPQAAKILLPLYQASVPDELIRAAATAQTPEELDAVDEQILDALRDILRFEGAGR